MVKSKKEPKKEDQTQELEIFDDPKFKEAVGEVLAAWHFTEKKHQRSRTWYIWFSIVIIAILLLALLNLDITIFKYADNNFNLSIPRSPFFAGFIIFALIVYVISEMRPSSEVQIAITEDGVLINNTFVEYEELNNFYIIYYPPEIKNLYFQPKSKFKPVIQIPLDDMNPVDIREVLLNYLEEDLEKEETPASEAIAHRLKL